jgi:4-carboxymuconolactone decarboxylase
MKLSRRVLAGVCAVFSATAASTAWHGDARAQQATRVVSAPLPKDVYADSRNRLPLPRREDLDDEGKRLFDRNSERTGKLAVGIEQAGVRFYSPRLAKAQADGSQYRKYETGLPNPLLEIAVLTTARAMDCQYEWTQWEEHGRDPKDPRHIPQSTIDIIKYEKPVVGLGEKETAIITFGREVFSQRKVTPATFAEVRRLFGVKGSVDLLWIMAGYSQAAAELVAFDQQLREGQQPLLPRRTWPRLPVRAYLPVGPAPSALPKDIDPDSRNRLPTPRREDLDDAGRKVFDQLTRKSELPVGFEHPSVRFHSPRLAQVLGESAHYLKYETGLSNRLLEIAVLTAARELDCQYEWTQWEEHGRDPKDPRHIEPAIIDAIKYRKPLVGLGAQEANVIAFGRQVFGDRKLSSATFADTLRLFGRKGTVDLLWLMAGYEGAAAELVAFDQQLVEGQRPLLPLAQAH